ncbi:biotin synthase auxiliary protein BsaP [Arthrobacter ramosus]|uniref:biotin synthase auxiliary protein BsaP n=1 Tax=Arthrobacter ramosus TaxID=1672 RepID=UPI003FD77096
MSSKVTDSYCGLCGGRPTSDAHPSCQQRLAMEPPRYCAVCRRRMKVQVTPLGWTAECSRHGRLTT